MSFRLFYILLIFAAVKCGEGIWAQEEGLASYYHHRFHGRKSSSGRTVSYTHLTLPTILLV